jgi:AcrR family transcriptional regulator
VSSGRPGRPPDREADARIIAAAQKLLATEGFTRMSIEAVAAESGVAKTTIYRRWPSKGALIADCLVDAFGPPPLEGASRYEVLATAIRWAAAKIGEPGVGAAFAGVFSDAVSDPALREVLSVRLQDPYRRALQDALGEPENRVLFFIDVVVGILLHRMGMTGEPMVEEDVDALVEMVCGYFADPA